MPLWLEASVARLRQLRQDGCSAAECARSLGKTRNQVIGKLSRLGILHRPTPPPPKPIIEYNGTSTVRAYRPSQPVFIANTPEDYSIPAPQRLKLVDLRGCVCKWPVGDPKRPDFFFCGAVTNDKDPYCPAHMRRALNNIVTLSSSASWASV